MSTLKTHNLQSPDGASVNIALAPNAGMVVTGISTFNNNIKVSSGQLEVGNNIKAGVAGVVTATAFHGSGASLTGLASREFYGFKTVNEDLILIHTNNGADNISLSDFESFEDTMTAPSGLSFSINSAGELEMTI